MSAHRIELVPLESIEESPVNPKAHDMDGIAESIEEHGLAELPMIDDRTGWLEAGHGRIRYLRSRHAAGLEPPAGVDIDADGSWLVPVIRGWASRDADQAARYLVASNSLTINGGWHEDELAMMLSELAVTDVGLVGTGYTASDLDELLASVRIAPVTHAELPQEDEIPEPPAEPITKRGDVWLLGPHRLMCGDCRDADDTARLLDGATPNLGFTSPPYADRRTYDESSGFVPVPPEQYVEWFAPVATLMAEHLATDGSWFVNMRAGCDGGQRLLYVNDLVAEHVRRWGWLFVDDFCWVDTHNGVPGGWPNRFKDAHEAVYHFARAGQIKFRPMANGTESSRTFDYSPDRDKSPTGSGLLGGFDETKLKDGLARPSNVLQIPAAAGEAQCVHAAPVPVWLPAWFIRAFTDEGDTVYDPFMGSGSTLLAAHQHDRIGYGMEISPAYCDVICARFERGHRDSPDTRTRYPLTV